MSIASERGDWWCGDGGGVTLSEIRRVLVSQISAKSHLLPAYRANLEESAQVWLLLYSTVEVARSVQLMA
jgi:hypothetical protein